VGGVGGGGGGGGGGFRGAFDDEWGKSYRTMKLFLKWSQKFLLIV